MVEKGSLKYYPKRQWGGMMRYIRDTNGSRALVALRLGDVRYTRQNMKRVFCWACGSRGVIDMVEHILCICPKLAQSPVCRELRREMVVQEGQGLSGEDVIRTLLRNTSNDNLKRLASMLAEWSKWQLAGEERVRAVLEQEANQKKVKQVSRATRKR